MLRFAAPWMVLLLGLFMSLLVAKNLRDEVAGDAVAELAITSDQVSERIADRLQTLGLVLRSGAGMFSAAADVGRAQWRAYVAQLEPQLNLPGIQGIGFAQAIPAEQLEAHIAAVRAEGFPQYSVQPTGTRPFYTSIVYLEPFTDRNLRAFGYDMYSEPVRRAAMDQARDSGLPTLSARVTLVQETESEVQAGTLMYFPVFRSDMPADTPEARGAALRGWVYSPYRMDDLVEGILGNWHVGWQDQINLYLYDGDAMEPAALLYASSGAHDLSPTPQMPGHLYRSVGFNGRNWLLVFDGTPALRRLDYGPAWRALGVGASLTLLLVALLLSLGSTRARAERMAQSLTVDLRARDTELAASEFRWKFALEGAGDGVWDWNLANDKVFFSRIWKEMLGYEVQEIGDGLEEWSKRVHPDDLPGALAAVREHVAGNAPYYVNEHRVQCKDGTYKWVLDRGMVVARDAAGKPLRMIGTHKDIDEHKRLEFDREQYLKFFRLSPEPLLICEPDGRLRRVNPALCKLLGYEESELLGKPFFDFMHPDDRAGSAAEQAAAIAGPRPTLDYENRYIARDGRVVYLAWTAFYDAAEGVSYAGARDITASRLLEHSLEEGQRELLNAQRIAKVGSWTFDVASGKARWSEQLFVMHGLEPAAEPPDIATLGKFFAPASWDLLCPALEKLGKDGTPYELELEMAHPDGRRGWMLARGEAVRDAAGRITAVNGIAMDMTERVLARMRIEHLSRLYAALGACNTAIVHVRSQDELFRTLCEVIVTHGNMQLAWIGLTDAATGAIVPTHWAGSGTAYLDGIEVSARADSPHGRGPTGTATRENRPVWVEQFKVDPSTSPWHERAASYGWVSSAALPLCRNGSPIGALTFYSTQAGWFTDDVRKLLEQMASDISFALDKFDAEAASQRYAHTLQEAEQRFRSLIEQSLVGAFIIQDERFVYVNPQFEMLLGYPHDGSLLAIGPTSIIAEKDFIEMRRLMDQLNTGELRNFEHMFTATRRDGTTMEVGTTIAQATYQGRPAIIGLLQDLASRKVAEEQIKRYARTLEKVFLQTVNMATNLVEFRDPYTAGHERHVAAIALAIGSEMNLDAEMLEGLRVGGYLHDVGKITVPAEILSKPGRISAAEYELIKAHPRAGFDILKDVDFPWPVAQIAYQHHERMDGSGYPQGLKGEAILLEARIIAVADIVESMSAHRPYRAALGIDVALAEIEQGRGTKYDSAVVDACLRLFREKGFTLPQ